MIFVANNKGTHSHLHYVCSAPDDGVEGWDRYFGRTTTALTIKRPRSLSYLRFQIPQIAISKARPSPQPKTTYGYISTPLEISLPR
jgi:hypothetical protein